MGEVSRNHKGEVLHLFSKHVEIKDSNEAELLAILEALHIFNTLYQNLLIVERDSSNAISWVNSFFGPWKMQFYLNEIRLLASPSPVSFQHISRSANSMAACLAKQGVDHSCNLSASIL